MSINYTNFRGEVYFLHGRKTNKGNMDYHFSKKTSGDNVVEQIPEGYEIYEHLNGKVFLRKPLKKLFHNDEIMVIKEAIENYYAIKDYKLDIKGEIIYIYTVSTPHYSPQDPSLYKIACQLDLFKEYETVIRFQLIEEEPRTFMVERYCFLGGIDDWIELEASTDIQQLAEEYLPQIGQETIFELF